MAFRDIAMIRLRGDLRDESQMTPAGLEPAIPGSVGRCLIHWATGPVVLHNIEECCDFCLLQVQGPTGKASST